MLFQLIVSALSSIERFSYDIYNNEDYKIDDFKVHVDNKFTSGSAIVNENMFMRYAAISEYNLKYKILLAEVAMYQEVRDSNNLLLPIFSSGVIRNSVMDDPVLAISSMMRNVNTFAVVSPSVKSSFAVTGDNAIHMLVRLAKQLNQLNSIGYYCYSLNMENIVLYDNQVYLYAYGTCTKDLRNGSFRTQLPFLFQADSEFIKALPYEVKSHIEIISQLTPSDFLIMVKQ